MEKSPGFLDRLIGRFLGTTTKRFHEVYIEREVVEEIINIAKKSYPQEFAALLEGKIENNILKIDGLVFLPGEVSNEGAVMKVFMKPIITGTIGSVHSHPGINAIPSEADYYFFSKNGLVHFIIAEPYNEDSMLAYDILGQPIDYQII
jgi:proteasome lid subunit RPN8/RPN11